MFFSVFLMVEAKIGKLFTGSRRNLGEKRFKIIKGENIFDEIYIFRKIETHHTVCILLQFLENSGTS